MKSSASLLLVKKVPNNFSLGRKTVTNDISENPKLLTQRGVTDSSLSYTAQSVANIKFAFAGLSLLL